MPSEDTVESLATFGDGRLLIKENSGLFRRADGSNPIFSMATLLHADGSRASVVSVRLWTDKDKASESILLPELEKQTIYADTSAAVGAATVTAMRQVRIQKCR